MDTRTEQQIKTYKGDLLFPNGANGRFLRDAKKLARQGWTVQSSTVRPRGFLVHESIIVVYTRTVQG